MIASAEKAVERARARRCRSSCCASACEHARCAGLGAARSCASVAAQSPDGGLIADYLGAVGDPRELAARLSATPGVVEHGLFAPELVSLILIAERSGVERRSGAQADEVRLAGSGSERRAAPR